MGLADFSEGAFLELLLSDVKRTEKMAASAKGNMVGNFVLQFLVFMPLFFYFVIFWKYNDRLCFLYFCWHINQNIPIDRTKHLQSPSV